MKIQYCDICGIPTGRCEDDPMYFEQKDGRTVGPLCDDCLNELQDAETTPTTPPPSDANGDVS